MLEVLGSIWWLIVVLGLLVTFHEFGHYWVARRCGVKVLRFSVGFGRPLWSRTAADGTEYQVAAIPLGGYVKMLDEREDDVPAELLDQSFNRKTVGQRFAIVAAGPVFNLVFAVLAFWLMFMVGVPEARPVVGETRGIAAEAGIRSGDEIVSLDGERTRSWSHALLALITHALDRDVVRAELEDENGRRRAVTLDLSTLGPGFSEENTLEEIGLEPWRATLPPVIGEVTPGSAAEDAGLQAGDRVLSIGGEETPDWNWIPFLVGKYGDGGKPFSMALERDGRTFELEVSTRRVDEGLLGSRYMLGVGSTEPDEDTVAAMERAYIELRYGPLDGLREAFAETWRLSSATVGLIGRMITGVASVKNVTGPIGIAQFANSSASAGLTSFLFFLGLISLSLGILNLLPIPILDGGHLMYYLIEWVTGRPVSDQVQAAGQYVGLAALFGLISLGVVNDILRLVG